MSSVSDYYYAVYILYGDKFDLFCKNEIKGGSFNIKTRECTREWAVATDLCSTPLAAPPTAVL